MISYKARLFNKEVKLFFSFISQSISFGMLYLPGEWHRRLLQVYLRRRERGQAFHRDEQVSADIRQVCHILSIFQFCISFYSSNPVTIISQYDIPRLASWISQLQKPISSVAGTMSFKCYFQVHLLIKCDRSN